MANVHQWKSKSFRPDEDKEWIPAKKLLAARDLNIAGYLRACLIALNADPDATLDTLAPHWPTGEGQQPAWMRTRNAQDQTDDGPNGVPTSS